MNKTLMKLLTWLKRHNPRSARLVFLNSHCTGWTTRVLTERMAKIRKKAKLPRSVKLHGLRHTFATQGFMHGVDVGAIMELLGHKQLSTIQRYAHLANKVD